MTSDTQTRNPRNRAVPELLAPAGSPAAFTAAVAAGADAVYLGGKRFGARQYAGNFSDAEMEEAVAFAHARGVKVYVTVNTLIHDRELAAAAEYLVRLYSIGADAVLLQDPGLASVAREVVPGLPLHASTQMTVHNAGGVRAAAAMGFSRVVLARELTLPEVTEIARETADTGTGLEVFAHGALCVSYSGQCLLSSVIGGRSGNRGMCAQPCRKPYALVAGNADAYGRPLAVREIPLDGEYLLSPKDLCTYPRLADLAASPVVSLKIEGRMKSPEYVAVVTAAYRRALDAIAAGRNPADADGTEQLALAFNRGFTEGYLFGNRNSAVMGREQPGNRGVFIGTVERVGPKTEEALVRLAAATAPVAGDGLYIGDQSGRPGGGLGFSLNATPARAGSRIRIRIPGRVRAGSQVFLTHSTALAAEARRIIAGGFPELRHPVPVDCTVAVDEDRHVAIRGTIDAPGGRKVPVTYRSDTPLVPARTRPLTAEGLRENLQKAGGTPFAVRCALPAYDGTLFAPVAEINRMRREFLARAEQAFVTASVPAEDAVRAARDRLAASPEPVCAGESSGGSGTGDRPVVLVYTDSPEGVLAAARAGCGGVCFEPDTGIPPGSSRCHGPALDFVHEIRAAMRACNDAGIPFAWKLPRITRPAELSRIVSALPDLCREGLVSCMAGNAGATGAIRSCCPDIRILGSAGIPVFNYRAALHAAKTCSLLTLSPELSGAEIAELVRRTRAAGCTVPFSLVAEGIAEAMVTENCIAEPALCGNPAGFSAEPGGFLGLRDGTGRIFPVRTDADCRTHIGNADETSLLKYIPAILDAGVGTIVVDARGRTPAYTGAMAAIYEEALRIAQDGGGDVPARLAPLVQRVRGIALGSLTAMHYARGLSES